MNDVIAGCVGLALAMVALFYLALQGLLVLDERLSTRTQDLTEVQQREVVARWGQR